MRTTNILTSPKTPTPSRVMTDKMDFNPSRQLFKTTPLTAYPTPHSSLDVTSPRTILTPASSRTSLSSAAENPVNNQVEDEIETYLKAHDELRQLYPHDDKVPHARICVLGGQSAGKSSFLSALTGIDLYCAERRATCCRTLISSRRSGLAFQAEVQIILINTRTQEANTVPFATGITNVKDMASICHWAGEEARRVVGATVAIRPWSTLSKLTDEEKKHGRESWPEFTKNAVIINVVGPDRPNFDIEDLPGLNGHHIPQNLVSDCISQVQNVIVLCLSAGSKDASSADPEILLARKYDPTGERTIGVITRADHIVPSLEDGSTFVDYLLEVGDHLGDFQPRGQWWPLRLRNHQERMKSISLTQVRDRETELFSQDDWVRIQSKTNRKFGIAEVEKRLEDLFAIKVKENIMLLKRSLKSSMKSNNDWLSINPIINDPIGVLHDNIIYRFAEGLKEKINRANQSGRLVDLQTQLEIDIQRALPEFIPFTGDEIEPMTYNSFWKTQGFEVEKQDRIPADVLLQKINEHTSRRNPDEVDSRAIMQYFQGSYIEQWDKITNMHIVLLWAEVEKLLLEVATHICRGNLTLQEEIIEKLEELTRNTRNETMEFTDQMIKLFSSPPSDLVISSIFRLNRMKDKSYQHFLNHLNQPLPDSVNNAPATNPASTSSSPISSVPRILHDTISREDREKCAKLQAKIGIAMMTWALEYSSVVGKYAQLRVLEYTQKVIPALRKGMGLEEVVESVKKRAGEKFESDRSKKRERAKRVKEMQKLNEIQQHLENIDDV